MVLQQLNTTTPLNAGHPPWLPAALKARLFDAGRLEYSGRVSEAERQVLRKKPQIAPSRWAEKHRVLTMSSLPGRWHNEVTPYLAGIMDASFFPSVREITVCKTPQTGGSEAIHNCVGYAIDRAPGPVLYTYPDILTGKENFSDRIRPMLESSTRLKSYLTGREDDLALTRISLKHMPIYLAWARSPARMANKPIKYGVSDEVDKFPPLAAKTETGPLELIDKRFTTYRWNYKHWKISTPTIESGHIWQAFEAAEVRLDFWVKCPECGEFQLMKFKNIKFPPDERDPAVIKKRHLAAYECEFCHRRWSDEMRNAAVRPGRWQDRETGIELFDYLKTYLPVDIAFHLPAWLSFFVSLSEIAAAFLAAGKDKVKLKDYKNNYEALPWLDYGESRSEDAVLELCDDRPRGLVPGGNIVAGLTGSVDTQADGFWYEIRAWSWGMEEESWKIRGGYITTFTALEQVLWSDAYQDADGNHYIVHLTIMDAMGGTQRRSAGVGTRTSEVYDFCRMHRGKILPFKGEQRMNQPYAYSKIDTYPGTNKAIPGGIQLLRANVTYYKNKLANKLEIAPTDPGAWHYHSEVTADWARQMISEYLDDNGLWQCPDGKDNHAWDISVYGLVAADVLGIKYWHPQGSTTSGSAPETGRSVRSKGLTHEVAA